MDWTLLIPVIVPLVVAAVKKMVSPKPWLLPPLAGALGVAADAVVAYVANVPMNPQAGMLLGLAGVGLRAVVDQLKQAVTA